MLLGTVSHTLGCGSSAGPVAIQPEGPAAALIAVPAPDDVQVATVDGRPVWGSCVADQIKREPKLTRQAALDQCIAFELLAQKADRFKTDREVSDATRAVLVQRLLDAFEAKYPDPDSLRAQIDDMFNKAGTTTRPELRASYYALIHLEGNQPADKLEAGRKAAEQLYAKLATETGLFPDHVRAATADIALPADMKFEFADYGAIARDNRKTVPEYVGALFGISEVGRVAPVVKTTYGFQVILLTELKPAVEIEREQVFAGLRRQLFVQFVGDLMKTHTIEVADLKDVFDEAPP